MLVQKVHELHVSNETNSGCLGFVGDYTTQLCGEYNKLNHYKDPYSTTSIMESLSSGNFNHPYIKKNGQF